MDDGFFDNEEIKKEETENQEKDVNTTMPPSKREKYRKIRHMVISIILAVVCFVSGGFAVWFSLDKEVRLLMKIKATIDGQYYQEVTNEMFYGAVFDAIDGTLDDYSYYMTADEYEAQTSESAGNRSGIGLVFSTIDGNGKPQMKIVRVSGNSPAESAGITAGSKVTGFGKSETELTQSVVFNEFVSFLAEYEAGERFFVQLEKDGKTEVVALTKEEYVENYVFYRTSTQSYGFTGAEATVMEERGLPLTCLDNDTAYIRLVQFGGKASENFEQAMNLFKQQGKKNLVLDLRENGGGYLDVMRDISKYFCKTSTAKRPVVAIADYGERTQKFKATDNVYGEYFSSDSRICVLADNGTASASECLIGCMVDYGAISYADICLSYRNGVAKTYGKGIMQASYYISGRGDVLKLTTAEIFWPSGYGIHGRGVLPEDGTKTVQEVGSDEAELALAVDELF